MVSLVDLMPKEHWKEIAEYLANLEDISKKLSKYRVVILDYPDGNCTIIGLPQDSAYIGEISFIANAIIKIMHQHNVGVLLGCTSGHIRWIYYPWDKRIPGVETQEEARLIYQHKIKFTQ